MHENVWFCPDLPHATLNPIQCQPDVAHRKCNFVEVSGKQRDVSQSIGTQWKTWSVRSAWIRHQVTHKCVNLDINVHEIEIIHGCEFLLYAGCSYLLIFIIFNLFHIHFTVKQVLCS